LNFKRIKIKEKIMTQSIKIYAMTLCCFLHISNIFAPSFGTQANKKLLVKSGVGSPTTQTTGGTPGACNSCCPPSTTTTTTPMPNFVISLYGATTASTATPTLINSYTFTTPKTFLFSSAILSVDIFPPSNYLVTGKVVPINLATENYAIVYTLKSLDGSTLQKSIQYGVTTPGNPTPSIAGTIFPTAIAISTSTMPTGATTAVQTPLFNQPLQFFTTTLASHSVVTQQRIFNAIGIIHQEFLITNSSSTVAATALSGMFNTSDGTTLNSCFITPAGGAVSFTPSPGTSLSTPIQIVLMNANGTQPITFPEPTTNSSTFTTTDLQNGLALNINIYPPSTANTSTSSYYIIATLRTLDGLKLHKQVIETPTFSAIPNLIQISYNSETALAQYWISQQINPTQQNLTFPANLRFIIQKSIADPNPNCNIIQI
jgi:hypothetical protein